MVVFDLAFISMGAIPRATQLRTSVPNAAQHDLESYSGPGGSEVQILSPRPFVSKTCIQFLVFRLRRCAVKRARIDGVTRHASSREFAVISLGDGRSCVAAGPSECEDFLTENQVALRRGPLTGKKLSQKLVIWKLQRWRTPGRPLWHEKK